MQAINRNSCEANPCPRCCSGQGGPPAVTGGHKASAWEASPGDNVTVGATGGHGRPVAATTHSAHAGLKLASSIVRPRVAMGGHNVRVSQRIAPNCGVNHRVDTRNQVALLMKGAKGQGCRFLFPQSKVRFTRPSTVLTARYPQGTFKQPTWGVCKSGGNQSDMKTYGLKRLFCRLA